MNLPSKNPVKDNKPAESRYAENELLAFIFQHDRDPRIFAYTLLLGLHPMHWSDNDACKLFYDLGEDLEPGTEAKPRLNPFAEPGPNTGPCPWGEPVDAIITRLLKTDAPIALVPAEEMPDDAAHHPLPESWRNQLEAWVAQIRQSAGQRCLLDIDQLCSDPEPDAALNTLSEIRARIDEWVWSPEWGKRVFAQKAAAATSAQVYRTGIVALDQKLGPLQPGQLLALVSRPSTGKRDLLLQMLLNQPSVAGNDAPCASIHFHGIAKSETALRLHLQSMITQVPIPRLRTNELNESERAIIAEADVTIRSLPVNWHCAEKQTIGKIAHAVFTAQRSGLRPLVVIDYLQMLSVDGFVPRPDILISRLLQQLKLIAHDHAVPLVVSCQMDNLPFSGNVAPGFHQLCYQSLAIEQLADTVITLPSCPQRENHTHPYPFTIKILKNRFGADGCVHLQRCPLTGTITSTNTSTDTGTITEP